MKRLREERTAVMSACAKWGPQPEGLGDRLR
jgi:hypothetical protein